MQAVYGLYHFVSPYWSEEICGRGHMWLECASDNVLIGRDRASVDEIREFRMSPSNDNDVSRVWEVMYQNVAKANNIIKLVPDMSLDGAFKNQALGTALFFRGFSMLWMVPYYGDDTNGGIPIITEKTPTAEIDSPRPSHVLQNYDQIIADFREAGDKLPYFSELPGRSNRSSAQGCGLGLRCPCGALRLGVRCEVLRHRDRDVRQGHGYDRSRQAVALHRLVG